MKILESLKPNIQKLKSVTIDNEKIEEFSTDIKSKDLKASEIALTKYDWEIENLLQLSFYFNSMNFCFWAEKDKPKWTVNIEGEELDGSIALFRSMESQLHKNPNFLDSKNIRNIQLEDFRGCFKGNVLIPLIKERYNNFKKSAEVLCDKYEGSFIKILEVANSDASTLLDLIANDFVSFEDYSTYGGTKINFLKRAQLQVKMTHDALISQKQQGLKNLNTLTAFADYKVPQILRYLGIINYCRELSDKVDSYELIEKDSDMENEIRIATIWGVELIKQRVAQKFPYVTSSHIDSYLWKKAQTINKSEILPYHRTYTTAY